MSAANDTPADAESAFGDSRNVDWNCLQVQYTFQEFDSEDGGKNSKEACDMFLGPEPFDPKDRDQWFKRVNSTYGKESKDAFAKGKKPMFIWTPFMSLHYPRVSCGMQGLGANRKLVTANHPPSFGDLPKTRKDAEYQLGFVSNTCEKPEWKEQFKMEQKERELYKFFNNGHETVMALLCYVNPAPNGRLSFQQDKAKARAMNHLVKEKVLPETFKISLEIENRKFFTTRVAENEQTIKSNKDKKDIYETLYFDAYIRYFIKHAKHCVEIPKKYTKMGYDKDGNEVPLYLDYEGTEVYKPREDVYPKHWIFRTKTKVYVKNFDNEPSPAQSGQNPATAKDPKTEGKKEKPLMVKDGLKELEVPKHTFRAMNLKLTVRELKEGCKKKHNILPSDIQVRQIDISHHPLTKQLLIEPKYERDAKLAKKVVERKFGPLLNGDLAMAKSLFKVHIGDKGCYLDLLLVETKIEMLGSGKNSEQNGPVSEELCTAEFLTSFSDDEDEPKAKRSKKEKDVKYDENDNDKQVDDAEMMRMTMEVEEKIAKAAADQAAAEEARKATVAAKPVAEKPMSPATASGTKRGRDSSSEEEEEEEEDEEDDSVQLDEE